MLFTEKILEGPYWYIVSRTQTTRWTCEDCMHGSCAMLEQRCSYKMLYWECVAYVSSKQLR